MIDEELSISDATLIARVRDTDNPICDTDRIAASDRIEALVKERDAANALLRELLADCQYEYPPSHGAIAYAIRTHLGAADDRA